MKDTRLIPTASDVIPVTPNVIPVTPNVIPVTPNVMPVAHDVIPAKAGIQNSGTPPNAEIQDRVIPAKAGIQAVTLPSLFLERLSQIIPPKHFNEAIKTFTHPFNTTFWINTLLADIETVLSDLKQQKFSLQKIDWLPNTFVIADSEHQRLTETTLYRNGHLYIQNLSSMIPAYLLNPQSNEQILDLTAAPGSKTIQMACLMKNEGHIAAVEVVKSRFFHLKANLEQHGVTNVKLFLKDGTTVGRSCPNRFDKVLLDAPCSSESRFKTFEPETYAYWSDKKIKEMSRKQQRLLYSALLSLKPGGSLIYSTCSFAPEENEAVINKILKKFREQIEIKPIALPIKNIQPGLTEWNGKTFHPDVQKCIRILPTDIMQGFFVCHIIKQYNSS